MQKLFISISSWLIKNQRILSLVFILLALTRFFQLNYLNWEYGELCTGHGGIQYGYDALRYTHGAESLVSNQPLVERENQFTGYILIIAFIKELHLGLEYVLIIQLLFALLAAYAIFDFCKLITGSRTAGVLAAGFLLVNPFIVQWHLFIHTESTYSSFLIISAWLICKAYYSRTLKYIIFASLSAIFTIMIRPNGWLIIPSLIAFVIIFMKFNWKYKIVIALFPILLLIFIINIPFTKKVLKDYEIESLSAQGVIIWEHPEINQKNYLSADSSKNISYGLHTIYSISTLILKRIAAELLPVYRPWLSWKFKIRFLLWMLPGYFFSILGLFYLFKNKGFILAFIILLFHLLFIGITYADQEFRFLIYIIPVISLLGSCGIYALWKKLYAHISEPMKAA